MFDGIFSDVTRMDKRQVRVRGKYIVRVAPDEEIVVDVHYLE